MSAISEVLGRLRDDIAKHEAEIAKLRNVEEYLASIEPQNGFATVAIKAAPVVVHEYSQRPQGQVAIARAVLQQLDRAAKSAEIVDVAISKGWLESPPDAVKKKNLANSIYGAMGRNRDIFQLDPPGNWSLIEAKAKETPRS